VTCQLAANRLYSAPESTVAVPLRREIATGVPSAVRRSSSMLAS